MYLSTENCTLDQRDLVQCLQEKIDKLSTALDLANTSLLSSKTTLKSVQEKCSSLQRDHQRKDLELTKAAERITQLTEVNRNSKLAYNHLLEQNNQYSRKLSGIQQGSSSSPHQDQWWKQLKEENKNCDLETEIKSFVTKQKEEQKKRKLTYNSLQTMVNGSIARNKEILKASKKENTKTNDLCSARTKVKSSIKAVEGAWRQVEDDFEDLVDSYNHVREEFDSVVAMRKELDERIVKFRSSVQKTHNGHEEMQQKMDFFNSIANQRVKKPRVQRRSDGISIVVFYS